MNRSLLLVVCDFLLLSLLALADFEQSGKPVVAESEAPGAQSIEETAVDSGMMDLLASALAAEQSAQSELEQKLAEAESSLSELEASRSQLSEDLAEKERLIAEREKLLAEREERLAEVRAEAERIAQEKAAAEEQALSAARERDQIAAERAAAKEETEKLSAEVEQLASRADTSARELEERSRELARLEAELAARSQRLQEAEIERARAESARQQLATQVESAEREKQILSSTLESARQTINSERREKEQLRQQTENLTEGVTRLAEASSEITEEVRSLRPKTTNEIYQEVDAARVKIRFEGARSGLFGENEINEAVDTVVTRIDGKPFVWIQLEQTPFADPERRKFLNRLEVYLEANGTRFRVPQLGVLEQNRSLLFLPLTESLVERIGTKVFPASQSPFRFEDLVVVDMPASRYGESSFQIDTSRPGQIEIDNRVFSALFGEFSPGPGDMAFTRTGEFLGIVTDPGQAWMAESVKTGGRINFGERFTRSQLNILP